MLNAIAGTYIDGTIELDERPQGISRSKVIVTFLTEDEGVEQPPYSSLGRLSWAQIPTVENCKLSDLYGICADDPIIVDDLGVLNEIDSDK